MPKVLKRLKQKPDENEITTSLEQSYQSGSKRAILLPTEVDPLAVYQDLLKEAKRLCEKSQEMNELISMMEAKIERRIKTGKFSFADYTRFSQVHLQSLDMVRKVLQLVDMEKVSPVWNMLSTLSNLDSEDLMKLADLIESVR